MKRALITRADDLASSHAANLAISEAAEIGIVRNVSVMACGPFLEEAAEMLAGNQKITFGMHGVVNAEWDKVVWGPVAPAHMVPSLIDSRGVFYQHVPEMAAAKPVVEEIITEYKYQLEKLRSVGFPIAYVDSHMMPEALIDGLPEAFDRWLEEEGLLNHRYFNKMLKNCGQMSHDRALFEKTIRELEPGQYKMVLHPARACEELRMTGNKNYSGDFICWEREDDYQFYNDPSVLQFLKEQDIELLSYKDAIPEPSPYSFNLWE